MNEKLIKFVREEGFCCLWAWLEANKSKLTSELMKELGTTCGSRALRYHRADHRRKQTECEGLEKCLKQKIKDGHDVTRKIP